MTVRLNQVTLAAKNMAESVSFYQTLGLTLIVDSAPRYVRFEFPQAADGSAPATLSLHAVEADWMSTSDWPLVYFEVDNIEHYLAQAGIEPLAPPEMKSYLWREADILDPSGQRIRIYTAGDTRRFPPWRVETGGPSS